MKGRSIVIRLARKAAPHLLLPCLLLTVAGPAAAQSGNDRFGLIGTLVGGLLVGGSDDYLDDGLGVEGSFTYRVLEARYLWIRADLGYLDTSAYNDPETGARIDNNMLILFAGPEVTYPIWRFEPFVRGYVGLARNSLSVSGSARADLNGTDTVFAWGFGPGLRGILLEGTNPVSIEFSARLVRTNELDFAASLAPRDPGIRERDIAILILGLGLRVGLR
ncbi:MAG: hypothetical protein JSU87_13285 [Gemmatimonadota bacterium]|nr:MAG: hypothetical protein JSU87_13285 [Gemmatimonadota bacterium]